MSDVEHVFNRNGSLVESEELADFSRGFVRLSPLFAPLSPFPPLCIPVLTESLFYFPTLSLMPLPLYLCHIIREGKEWNLAEVTGERINKQTDTDTRTKGEV